MIAYGFGRTREQVLQAVPRLAALTASKSGHMYFLPDLSLSASTVLSIPYGLENLVPFLRSVTG